jgi:hypothetical protein
MPPAFWLAIHMLGDVRAIRFDIIASQLDRLAVETDGAVIGNLRMGLKLLLGLSNAPFDYEEVNERLVLAGLQDDHATLKAIDALRPRMLAALAPAAPSHPRHDGPGF